MSGFSQVFFLSLLSLTVLAFQRFEYFHFWGSKIQLKNQYSKNTFFAEKICIKNFENIKILRVANLFGILRIKPGIIEKIILQYLKVNKFKFFKEDTIRSFVSIDDFVKILKRVINYENTKKIYDISNENYVYSVKNFLRTFNKIYGNQII